MTYLTTQKLNSYLIETQLAIRECQRRQSKGPCSESAAWEQSYRLRLDTLRKIEAKAARNPAYAVAEVVRKIVPDVPVFVQPQWRGDDQ